MGPTFPLTVIHEDGAAWVLATPEALAATVEWFDSDDADPSMRVVDAQGRPVRLKVVALTIQTIEIADAAPAPAPRPAPRKAVA